MKIIKDEKNYIEEFIIFDEYDVEVFNSAGLNIELIDVDRQECGYFHDIEINGQKIIRKYNFVKKD